MLAYLWTRIRRPIFGSWYEFYQTSRIVSGRGPLAEYRHCPLFISPMPISLIFISRLLKLRWTFVEATPNPSGPMFSLFNLFFCQWRFVDGPTSMFDGSTSSAWWGTSTARRNSYMWYERTWSSVRGILMWVNYVTDQFHRLLDSLRISCSVLSSLCSPIKKRSELVF